MSGEAVAPLTDDEKWAAVVACDHAFDGRFFYGVATTGVFCRPSCRARTPRRENVLFFDAAGDALTRGFRPCKRCRPDLPAHDPALALVRAAEDVMRSKITASPAGLSSPAKDTPPPQADAPASPAATLTPASLAASLGVSPSPCAAPSRPF